VKQVLTVQGKAREAWVAVLLGMILIGLLGYANRVEPRPRRRDHARPGDLGLRHRQLHLPRGRGRGRRAARRAGVRVPPEAHRGGWWRWGELLAISALTMCLTFILVDMGRPDRLTHILPGPGNPNWPSALLSWDALVLNACLVLNLVVDLHILYRAYLGKEYAEGVRGAARALQHPGRGGHPHRDGLPLRGHGGAPLLERRHPGAEVPRLRLSAPGRRS